MIDWNKPIQARNGKAARYLGTLNNPTYSRAVALTNAAGGEVVLAYCDDGKLIHGALPFGGDVQNVSERIERYANVYPDGIDPGAIFYHTRGMCLAGRRTDALGSFKFTFENQNGKVVFVSAEPV